MTTIARAALLAALGVVGGLAGSAGGITSLVSYPALLAVGLSSFRADVTNLVAVVALLPGSAVASRPELKGRGRWLRRWMVLTALASALGSVLLLTTPPGFFKRLVPFLVLSGSLALLVQPVWSAHRRQRTSSPATSPAATSPAATSPAATSPAATRPGATGPGATGPGATSPGATSPEATGPGPGPSGPRSSPPTSVAQVGRPGAVRRLPRTLDASATSGADAPNLLCAADVPEDSRPATIVRSGSGRAMAELRHAQNVVLPSTGALGRDAGPTGPELVAPKAFALFGLMAVSVYGGYFGAGSGVMTLAVLLLSTAENLPRANALKNMLVGGTAVVSALIFALFGPVDWSAALPLGLGMFVGSTLGPQVARRAPSGVVRWCVAFLGTAFAVQLWLGASW